MIRTALTTVAICIATNAAHAQQFPLTDITLHEWGGTASYTPNGQPTLSASRTYGPDAAAGGMIRPHTTPPSGGIAIVSASSEVTQVLESDFEYPHSIVTNPYTGGETYLLNPANFLSIEQGVTARRNSTITFDADMDLTSLIEWTVPSVREVDGLAMGYTVSVSDDTVNGGSATFAGTVRVTNVDTGQVLYENLGVTSTETGVIALDAEPGETIRFEATPSLSGTFPSGSSSFGRASLVVLYEIAVVTRCDPAAAPCLGDANLDGTVDVNDISYVLFRLGDPCD